MVARHEPPASYSDAFAVVSYIFAETQETIDSFTCLDALDVDVRDLAFDRLVSIRVAADLLNGSGQNFEFAGTVGPVGEELRLETVPFDVRSSLRELPLGTLVSLLPSELPVRTPFSPMAHRSASTTRWMKRACSTAAKTVVTGCRRPLTLSWKASSSLRKASS